MRAVLQSSMLLMASGLLTAAAEPAPSPATSAFAAPASATSPSLRLTLDDALRLAHTQGRDRLSQAEELRLKQISLRAAQRGYRPRPSAQASVAVDGTGTRTTPGDTETARLGATQLLPGGAEIGANASVTRDRDPGPGQSDTTTAATLSISQPLLQGGGALAWREELTAAERAAEDAQRTLARYRQELSLTIARSFWSLQRQGYAVEQARAAVTRTAFTVAQSRALMDIGRATVNELLRAEASARSARQTLVDQDAARAASLDGLAQALALPLTSDLTIVGAPPPVPSWRIDGAAAIATALAQRHDLWIARDRASDSQRLFALARNRLLPRLNLEGSATYDGRLGAVDEALRGPPDWRVALTLDLQLDDRAQQRAYEEALIATQRSQRAFDAARDRAIAEVRDALRDLRQAEESVAIQDLARREARRREEKAQLDFQAGGASNRDLVEAQAEVVAADNAWFAARIALATAGLGLRLATGTLIVSSEGTFDDDPPPFAVTVPASAASAAPANPAPPGSAP